ncbi:hypothetical protein OS493_037609 [Desmophyllum pertusum]|uniref:G-protein coupled receptors family 1 profile domain-containing protein n=1 Tax=Desmophyllum pertusum TaxID=174260 RepID=A0A9W9ZHU7_9CNID|nr:hypothetical protein OS493_037609 [Desmophyllum pertusum]
MSLELENNATYYSNTTATPPSEEDKTYFNAVYDGLLIVLSVLVIAINVLVISLFFYKEYLQTKTNSLLISLAVSDLMVGVLAIPLSIACNAILEEGVCIAAALIYRFIAVSTMYHILVVTLERYIYVMYPMKYINIVTVPRLLKAIAGLWLFSLFVSLIQLAWEDPTKFFEKRDEASLRYALGYNIFGLVFCFFLPALFMAISYVRMFMVIHRQIKEIQGLYNTRGVTANQRAPIATETRALFIFALMLTIFIVCWLSFYVTGFLIYLVEAGSIPIPALMAFDYIRFAVAFVNPILYAFLKRDFSKALKSLCRSRDGIQPGELASCTSTSRLRTITINLTLSRSASETYRDN